MVVFSTEDFALEIVAEMKTQRSPIGKMATRKPRQLPNMLLVGLVMVVCISAAWLPSVSGFLPAGHLISRSQHSCTRASAEFSLWDVRTSRKSISRSSFGLSLAATTVPPSSGFSLEHTTEDSHTVSTFISPSGQSITLIGTAHLSKKSNEQVQRLIEEIQPNVVMVELDPTRLHRIGIQNKLEIKVPRVVTSEDIILPTIDTAPKSIIARFLQPFWILQEVLTETFSRIARAFLTGMYNDMSDKMDNPKGGGGEFLVAIRAAEKVHECNTLVLGDRSSVTTIKRAAMLALQSGDPLGVLARLQEANSEEMRQLEQTVRNELEEQNSDSPVDDSQVQVGMMEALKEDSLVRDRLFRKLEQEVPEFTQAFLKERDYIMAEAIRRELELSDRVQRVVGIVGLAHVPGMEQTLLAMFANETVPLLQEKVTEG